MSTASGRFLARALVLLALSFGARVGPIQAQTTGAPETKSWRFAVAGDSRNCGDVVMPAIASATAAADAEFYWHLGDFRALYDFDQDFLHQTDRRGKHVSISDYQRAAWDDFIRSQLEPFAARPVFLGIGNHELVPPKTRNDFLLQFADWFDSEPVRRERLQDDPNDHRLKTWYHWIHRGIDFVNLDNASSDQFEAEQLRWIDAVIGRAEKNPRVRAIVVGMHAALPDSLASSHSMNDWAQGEQSGRRVYARLVQASKSKPVYILASHSHFYMSGIFGTRARKAAGEVLPGWIIGTGGAVRYALPPGASQAAEAKTNVSGYLLATVSAPEDGGEPIRFEFKQIDEGDIPAATVARFGGQFVHDCMTRNTEVPETTPEPAPSVREPSHPAPQVP